MVEPLDKTIYKPVTLKPKQIQQSPSSNVGAVIFGVVVVIVLLIIFL